MLSWRPFSEALQARATVLDDGGSTFWSSAKNGDEHGVKGVVEDEHVGGDVFTG